MNPLYIVKVFVNVGPTILCFGMGFWEKEVRDDRGNRFTDAMQTQLQGGPANQIFDVQHVGGVCRFYAHQICAVLHEEAAVGDGVGAAQLLAMTQGAQVQ